MFWLARCKQPSLWTIQDINLKKFCCDPGLCGELSGPEMRLNHFWYFTGIFRNDDYCGLEVFVKVKPCLPKTRLFRNITLSTLAVAKSFRIIWKWIPRPRLMNKYFLNVIFSCWMALAMAQGLGRSLHQWWNRLLGTSQIFSHTYPNNRGTRYVSQEYAGKVSFGRNNRTESYFLHFLGIS